MADKMDGKGGGMTVHREGFVTAIDLRPAAAPTKRAAAQGVREPMSIDEDRLMDLENQLDEAQKEIERRDGQIEDLVVTCERLEAELKAMTVSRDEYKSAFSDFLHYASNARDEYKSCERREP